jgi:hypothetical protein
MGAAKQAAANKRACRSGEQVGRPGPLIDVEFESAVLAKFTNQVLEKSKCPQFFLQSFIIAGKATAREEPFRDRKLVTGLKFSKGWARGVLRRHLAIKV